MHGQITQGIDPPLPIPFILHISIHLISISAQLKNSSLILPASPGEKTPVLGANPITECIPRPGQYVASGRNVCSHNATRTHNRQQSVDFLIPMGNACTKHLLQRHSQIARNCQIVSTHWILSSIT